MAEEPGVYWERLDAYEEEGLKVLEEKTGHRRKKRTKQIKKDSRRSHKRVSRTDPEAGHMKRPGKPEGQYYLSHQALDTDHGIILYVTVTPGDVNDSVPYLNQLEHIHKGIIPIRHGGRRLRFPAGPPGTGRAGDFFLCQAAAVPRPHQSRLQTRRLFLRRGEGRLSMSQREAAAVEGTPPHRQRAVLRILGAEAGLPKLPDAGTMPQPGGQTGGTETGGYLLPPLGSEKSGTPE